MREQRQDKNKNKKDYRPFNNSSFNNESLYNESFNNFNNVNEDINVGYGEVVSDRPLKLFGGVCLAISILIFAISSFSTKDTSQAAKDAMKSGVSTTITQGTIIDLDVYEAGIKDYTITHNSNTKESKIWVWDYADVDGDYVQVLVDGIPVSEVFMVKNKPKEFIVPVEAEVQVKGVKDGIGGISYAVRYEINGTSYFNQTPEGQANTYTLAKE